MQLRHSHPFLIPHLDDGFISFAHRGGTPHLPENSLASFEYAVGLGYRYIETDVQLTRDGVLVAFHDSNLERTCGMDRDISTLTSAELAGIRIDGKAPIPLLEELFEAFPSVFINLDAKSDVTVEPLISFLRSTNSLGRVCIGSFSHKRLQRIRVSLGEKVCTSASPREVAAWMAGVPVRGPSCLQIPLQQGGLRVASSAFVQRSTRHGVPVHVWTIDEPGIMQSLLDAGVHGIMTDDAETLKKVAERNAIWH